MYPNAFFIWNNILFSMLEDGRLHTMTFQRLISVLKPQGYYSESPTACGLFLPKF